MTKTAATQTATSRGVLIISALDYWSMGKEKGGQALWRTLEGYATRGWKVWFVTGNRAPSNHEDLPPNVYVARFDLPWLKRFFAIKKLGFFAKAVWWLCFQSVAVVKGILLRRSRRIDVVYGYEVDAVPAAKLLAVVWRVPLVSRFQGSTLRLVGMKRRLWRLRFWESVLAYRLAFHSDLIIMTNDGSQGDRLLSDMGIPTQKVRFWINGIDQEQYRSLPEKEVARRRLRLCSHHVVLCVSRLIRIKRVDRAIAAMAHVLKDKLDAVLVVVGDGVACADLQSQAQELGISEHVRFEGSVSRANLTAYYAAADIFLSFYDWTNVGNPLLEAMMAGKCIVTLNNGDTGQFVHDGLNGVLLEYDDLPRLPQVIGDLLADVERRKKLGANARRFAEENFWGWGERMEAEISEVESLISRPIVSAGHTTDSE